MKKTSLLIATCVALTGVVQAATISYSGTASSSISVSPTAVSVNVQQFDQATLGTLTGVTLSLVTASMTATVSLENIHPETENWVPVLNNGFVSFNNGVSETLVAFDNDGMPGTSFRSPTTVPQGVNAFSPNIPSASSSQNYGSLASYIGTGNVSGMQIEFYGSWGVEGMGTGDTFGVTEFDGSAQWEVTYTYTAVPEPTSMALLALGCAVLGLRRRPRSTLKV